MLSVFMGLDPGLARTFRVQGCQSRGSGVASRTCGFFCVRECGQGEEKNL